MRRRRSWGSVCPLNFDSYRHCMFRWIWNRGVGGVAEWVTGRVSSSRKLEFQARTKFLTAISHCHINQLLRSDARGIQSRGDEEKKTTIHVGE